MKHKKWRRRIVVNCRPEGPGKKKFPESKKDKVALKNHEKSSDLLLRDRYPKDTEQ